MANTIYPKAKEAFLKALIDMDNDTIKVALVDTGVYTYSSSHEFYDDVSSSVIGAPETLVSKTFTGGVFDAADVVLTGVSGDSIEAAVIYLDTGDEATSNLIVYIDVATGLPVTPNGGNITIQWDSGSNKIFAL